VDTGAVPQDDNATLAGQRKMVYARGADGRMVGVPSRGWEAEAIVTGQAVEAMRRAAQEALQRAREGRASALEYWMLERRMDPALLAAAAGLWRWRVRRHLRPAVFARLSPALRARYAQALGIAPADFECLP
jgi:hypothetical protein